MVTSYCPGASLHLSPSANSYCYSLGEPPLGLSLLCQHTYEHNTWQKHWIMIMIKIQGKGAACKLDQYIISSNKINYILLLLK